MKNSNIMRIVCSVLCILMVFCSVFTVSASEDTRTEIATFVGTSDLATPVYGEAVVNTINATLTEGTEGYITPHMGGWYKKNGDDWYKYNDTVFREGSYCYKNQLRIDDANGKIYKLSETLSVTIDQKVWSHDEVYYGTNYSCVYIQSPEYIVEKLDLPLSFTYNQSLNIGNTYANYTNINFSVSGAVIGGSEPYVFSKVSGPEWLAVSQDGTVSGTPTSSGKNDNLVIRVTDNEENYKEISIPVAETYIDPATRTAVSVFVGTSDLVKPKCNAEVDHYFTATLTVGTEGNITPHMGGWYVKDGDNWTKYNNSVFEPGKTYRYENQLRIDGSNGNNYKLGETLSVTIDGENWTHDDVYYGTNYSYVYIISPEILVEHYYDYDCDTDCNGCNEIRIADHKYTNAVDSTCDYCCGYVRTLGAQLFEEGGVKYYYYDGVKSTATGIVDYQGKKMYINKGRFLGATGLVTVGGKKMYINKGYFLGASGLVTLSGKKTYINKGYFTGASGLVTISGKKMYINKGYFTGASGLVTISGKKLYINKGYFLGKTGIVKIGSKRYYINKGYFTGASGTVRVGGKTYKVVKGIVK